MKTRKALKLQHVIRLRLKTPTTCRTPVDIYQDSKSRTQTHDFVFTSCFLPVPTVPPWHIVYLWGETVETSGLFAAASFWVQLDGGDCWTRTSDLLRVKIRKGLNPMLCSAFRDVCIRFFRERGGLQAHCVQCVHSLICWYWSGYWSMRRVHKIRRAVSFLWTEVFPRW